MNALILISLATAAPTPVIRPEPDAVAKLPVVTRQIVMRSADNPRNEWIEELWVDFDQKPFMAGDVIRMIDGYICIGPDSIDAYLYRYRPGAKVKVVVERGGKRVEILVTTVRRLPEVGPPHYDYRK